MRRAQRLYCLQARLLQARSMTDLPARSKNSAVKKIHFENLTGRMKKPSRRCCPSEGRWSAGTRHSMSAAILFEKCIGAHAGDEGHLAFQINSDFHHFDVGWPAGTAQCELWRG